MRHSAPTHPRHCTGHPDYLTRVSAAPMERDGAADTEEARVVSFFFARSSPFAPASRPSQAHRPSLNSPIAQRLPMRFAGPRHPGRQRKPQADYAVEIRYIGHSTFRIKAPGRPPSPPIRRQRRCGPAAGRGHHESCPHQPFHEFSRSGTSACPQGWGENGAPAQTASSWRGVGAQRHHRHPQLHGRRGGRQLDLHLRDPRPVHRSHPATCTSRCRTCRSCIGRLDVASVPVDGSYTWIRPR